MLAAGTGSSHTVCQMPEQGVYIMPPGCFMALTVCLPFGSPLAPVAVQHSHNQLILGVWLDDFAQVETERIVAPLVGAYLLAIDPNDRIMVHGPEVQEQAFVAAQVRAL